MEMETITTLTVLGFGNIALIFVLVWVIQTWREELARNRSDETGGQAGEER